MKRRALLIGSLLLPLASTKLLAEQSDDGIKRLAIQISDGDPKTYTKALNVVANFARGMSSKGEMFEIEIVAFNAGINLLRTDKSPMIDRVKSLSESIPDITFSACGNTIAGITRKKVKHPHLRICACCARWRRALNGIR